MPNVSFDYSVSNVDLQVGGTVRSPIDYETSTNGQFMRLDGRLIDRGPLPELSALLPYGKFTYTTRTNFAAPNSPDIVNDDTLFLMPGAAGTQPLQATPDGGGTAWTSAAASWTAGTAVVSLIYNNALTAGNSRFIIAGSGGDLTVPYVTNAAYLAAKTVANVTTKATYWTATTAGTTTALPQAFAYAPSAVSALVGRTVYISDASSNTIYTLDDGATAWVARTTPNAACVRSSVCWTGQRFIVLAGGLVGTNRLQVSTDGITWADEYHYECSFNNTSNAYYLASNGNGTVVFLANTGSTYMGQTMYTSTDHGVTWAQYSLPIGMSNVGTTYNAGVVSINRVEFIKDRFIVYSGTKAAMSKDGKNWQVIIMNGAVTNLAWKAGIWAGSGCTLVEDASKIQLPYQSLRSGQYASGGSLVYTFDDVAEFDTYMKVKS